MTNINLFVVEMEPNSTEVSFATWLRCVLYNTKLYGIKASCSDLLGNDEVVCVKLGDTVVNKDYDYFIYTVDPKKDARIGICKKANLRREIIDAIYST